MDKSDRLSIQMGFSAWIKRRIAGIFCVCARCWAIKLHMLSAILIYIYIFFLPSSYWPYKTLSPTVLLLLHNCIDFPGDSDSKESAHNGETTVRTLSWEDPLEKGMATHSSILAWKIPWTEELGRLQSMGSQRVGQDWRTNADPLYRWGAWGWHRLNNWPQHTQDTGGRDGIPSPFSLVILSSQWLASGGGWGWGRWMETPMEKSTWTSTFQLFRALSLVLCVTCITSGGIRAGGVASFPYGEKFLDNIISFT